MFNISKIIVCYFTLFKILQANELMECKTQRQSGFHFLGKDYYEIITTPQNFGSISKYFENKNVDIEGQISLSPKNVVEVSKEDSNKIIRLLELLEEQEDVQKVHSNFQIK